MRIQNRTQADTKVPSAITGDISALN